MSAQLRKEVALRCEDEEIGTNSQTKGQDDAEERHFLRYSIRVCSIDEHLEFGSSPGSKVTSVYFHSPRRSRGPDESERRSSRACGRYCKELQSGCVYPPLRVKTGGDWTAEWLGSQRHFRTL